MFESPHVGSSHASHPWVRFARANMGKAHNAAKTAPLDATYAKSLESHSRNSTKSNFGRDKSREMHQRLVNRAFPMFGASRFASVDRLTNDVSAVLQITGRTLMTAWQVSAQILAPAPNASQHKAAGLLDLIKESIVHT